MLRSVNSFTLLKSWFNFTRIITGHFKMEITIKELYIFFILRTVYTLQDQCLFLERNFVLKYRKMSYELNSRMCYFWRSKSELNMSTLLSKTFTKNSKSIEQKCPFCTLFDEKVNFESPSNWNIHFTGRIFHLPYN